MLKKWSSHDPLIVLVWFLLVLAAEWLILVGGLSLAGGTYFLRAFSGGRLPAGLTVLYISSLYVAVAGTIWFFWCRLLGRTAADLGLVMNEGAVRQLLAGLAAAGGVAVAYYGTLFLAGCASFVRLDTLTLPFLAANLGGALAMAFTEEVFFRGFILRLILPRAGAAGTVALSSLIFAASHMFRSGDLAFKAAYFAGIFLLGLVLARGALSSGSLSLPVGFHWGLIFLIILHSAVEPLAGAPHESIIIGLKGTPAAGLLLWIIFAALSLAAGKPRTGRLQTKAPR